MYSAPQEQPQRPQPRYDPGQQRPATPPQWQPAAPPRDYQPPAQYQPTVQQPPAQYQPLQYGAPPRKKHTGLKVLAGIGGGFLLLIVIAVAASSGHTVQTAGSAAGTRAQGGTQKTAGIGSAITMVGNTSGEQMAVTVTKVISDATPGDEFNAPPSGDRLYAVQFRLADTGTAAYSDAPSNGATVVDSVGQSYQSSLETVAGCESFGATENIAPGSSGLGCITFEVPKSAKITKAQFTLDSGMGPQTGQWNVS